jgi:hypothetical protein
LAVLLSIRRYERRGCFRNSLFEYAVEPEGCKPNSVVLNLQFVELRLAGNPLCAPRIPR